MNKHQSKAAIIAVVAIVASFALWTKALDRLDFPDLSNDLTDAFNAIIEDVIYSYIKRPVIAVQEVEVKDLGAHFVESVAETHLEGGVAHTIQQQHVVKQTSTDVPETIPTDVATVPSAPLEGSLLKETQTSADELSQWELAHTWRITIPDLGIRAPVLLPSMKYWGTQAWDLLEQQMQVGLNHGAVAYPHSVSPGVPGSLIIAGHSSPPHEAAKKSNYGHLFAKLPDIAIGQEITVTTSGAPIVYRVEQKQIVSPKMTTILEQQYDQSVLKLITCYPVGTTRDRMIVLAKKVE